MPLLGLSLRRLEKALVALLAVSGTIWLIEPLHMAIRPYWLIAVVLSVCLGCVVATARLFSLARWVVRRALWRVRHRMVVVFFFVGALPVTLSVLLVLLAVSFLFGPLTAYLLTTELEQVGQRLSAAAGPLALHLQEAPSDRWPSVLDTFHADAEPDFPGLVIQAEFGGTKISVPRPGLAQEVPASLGEARGLVRSGDALYIVTIEEDLPSAGRMLLGVPVTSELVAQAIPGMGILGIERLDVPDTDDSDGRGSWFVPIVRGNLPAEGTGTPEGESRPGWRIFWPIRSQALDLDTAALEYSTYVLLTRPWDLWSKIFGALPEGAFVLFKWLLYALLAAFAGNVLASLLIATSMTRTLTKAVHDLYVGTRHVNKGEFSYRIPESGYDQISDLSRSFNTMTASIEGLIEESKQRQQMEAELEIARDVQARLFPTGAPTIQGLEVLGLCRPARSVSGDFYDYVSLGRERVGISFGDVSGKGISAALLMASLHSIMRAQCAQAPWGDAQELEESAARLVQQANEQLYASTDSNMFSTLFFGAYDARNGRLAYANAGHLPPLVLRNGNARALDVTGPIVGAFPSAGFSAATLAIESGDTLVAYTDGLTEPENESGEAFGEERLIGALNRGGDRPLRSLIETVMDEVVAWTGQSALQDDMTMMVLRKV